MQNQVLGVVEDEERDEGQSIALQEFSLRNGQEYVVSVIAEMIEERTVAADSSDNPIVHQQLKGYVMALEDVFYRLYGKQLDVGQDIDPPDMEGF